MRGDVSGLALTEYRLQAGFLNCPVPFWGARRLDDINRILTDSAFGIRAIPLISRTTTSIGDIEVGALLQLFNTVRRDSLQRYGSGVRAAALLDLPDAEHGPVLWLGVLRSMSAMQMYQRTVRGPIEGRAAVRFALLDALQETSWADIFRMMLKGAAEPFAVRPGFCVAIVLTTPEESLAGESLQE